MTQSIAWLQDEIANRMLQKLDIVKLEAKGVLIIPDFRGDHASALTRRFSKAGIYSVTEANLSTLNLLRLKASRLLRSGFRSSAKMSVSEYQKTGRINLSDQSVDLVFSDLLIQDLEDPQHFLQECWRVLREGGLLTFSYLGPDTGKELRAQKCQHLPLKKLASPWDMHDMGDALLAERFADPVMDMEFLNLDYADGAVFLEDVIALNLMGNVTKNGADLERLPKKLTLEVVYGHAWAIGKNLAKAKNQIAYIDPNQIIRKTRKELPQVLALTFF